MSENLRLWRDGESVLLDHVGMAPTRRLASGTVVALDGPRRIARPVVCAEIVWENSEDGRVTTRCAAPMVHLADDGWTAICGHGRSWRDS
jgi:hypothetical protein